ncbi:UNKNOWN [Stylonychia lemnae]|uniref:GT44 domain-containing protein n=1 Tax=Stylonychia lemnae TaxID=5949 RepID=A0A078BE63_STYLE|nr:UNKNOWN [Stylonychia lemnae]|eukprot:CDW91432.1 UNKNOWN [Stylonychia lemnae]
MNFVISLITTAFASFNLAQFLQDAIYTINLDPLLQPVAPKIQFFEEVVIAANELEFCFYPSAALHSPLFIMPYLETIGVDERYHYIISPARLQTGFKNINKPTKDQIPFITHSVWLTNPRNPKEMLSQVDESSMHGYDFHLNVTHATLSKHNFTSYLWTNNIDVLPETQKWALKQGVIMRELSEFSSVKEHKPILDEIDRSIELKQFAGGADIARLLILYELGGLYTDQDHQIIQYDPLLNKMNLFFYEHINVGFHTLENSLIGASPKNNYILEYMRSAVRTRQGQHTSHFESSCYQKSERYIHYETGPFRMSSVFNQLLINGNLDDQLLVVLDQKITFDGFNYINSTEVSQYNNVVFKDGTHNLNVQFKHHPTGSWKDPNQEKRFYGWQNKNSGRSDYQTALIQS